MNRKLVVGGVLFGLLLAALSVGISTFISAQDTQATKLEIQKISIDAKKVNAAGGGASGSTTGGASSSSATTSAVPALNANGGEASDLSSTGYLWSKGPFLVTDSYADSNYMFSVDATDGARVYKGVALTVEDQLTVNKESLLSDVDASGKVTVAGLVTGGSFSNAGGSFLVDSKGGVKAGLINAGTGTFASGLTLTGGKFSIGTLDSGVVWDPQLKEFIVVGQVVAADYVSRTGQFNLTGNVVADSFALASGLGSWSTTGTVTTKALVVNEDAAVRGNLGVTGDVSAANITATNAVRSDIVSATTGVSTKNLSASDKLTVGFGTFVVDSSGATLAGKLHVDGDVEADNLYALINGPGTGNVDAAGQLSAGSIKTSDDKFSVSGGSVRATGTVSVNGPVNVNGDIDGNFIGTIASGVSVSSNNVTAKQNLRVGTSPSYVFTVDSAGNVAADGDLTVGGDVIITGSVTASNIPHIRSGVAVVSGAPENVTISGMPSTASVVLTPRFSTTNPVYVSVSSGNFNVHGDDGSYSWIATW